MRSLQTTKYPNFRQTLHAHGLELSRGTVRVLQINVGKRCNQACHHCHVDAGPKRSEMMTAATADRVLELLRTAPDVHTLDITGGAPELNPQFRRLVVEARALERKVIDRCNLTVLFEPGQEGTAQFLARHGVSICASLPCYSRKNVEQQRGLGVFDKSIEALRMLNEFGFGVSNSGLELNLVYNPLGPTLPPPQATLEADYRAILRDDFGVTFNQLYSITNMPISRFLRQLIRENHLEQYMDTLVQAFNPVAAKSVMCRELLSVGWNGCLYDCDFNQMLELPLARGRRTLWDIGSLAELANEPLSLADHCYGCTAGAGSSCSGVLT